MWICSKDKTLVVDFRKSFKAKNIKKAVLKVASVGNYYATINGCPVTDSVLNPGNPCYSAHIPYIPFDVTSLLREDNLLSITVAPGWAVGHMGGHDAQHSYGDQVSLWAELTLTSANGKTVKIATDETFNCFESQTRFSDIYFGEIIDRTYVPVRIGKAVKSDFKTKIHKNIGAEIREQEHLNPVSVFTTRKGEKVVDFGQNMTGYVQVKLKPHSHIKFYFGEVLDKDGNFYNANYRTCKDEFVEYTSNDKEEYFKPLYSFQGFRYLLLAESPEDLTADDLTAIVVYSEMKRLGQFACGNEKINQLYHNIIWGNKSNYLDIPTDCPQRDERLGWTGDTQVFCKTASLNFDVRKFFKKWLLTLRDEQTEEGVIASVLPCPWRNGKGPFTRAISAACGWGDVATIAPWTMYETYGDISFLAENFDMMKRWVEYLRHQGPKETLWLEGTTHYGDWLAMDHGEDSYLGITNVDLLASAFYAYSCELLVRAGKVLGKDMAEYEDLHERIVKDFRLTFMENGLPKESVPLAEVSLKRFAGSDRCDTQTALVLILQFHLCADEERKTLVDLLVKSIENYGYMTTGFLGTPYILHALTDNGRSDVAYKLFFNEMNPSWLYSVNHGATTMWEHWNSVKENGDFWSTDMNSFNHYAYGCVGDWMYGDVAGIKPLEAGYKKLLLCPHPDKRLGFVNCSFDSDNGKIVSNWYYKNDEIYFEFTVPKGATADICLPDGKTYSVCSGTYQYVVKA